MYTLEGSISSAHIQIIVWSWDIFKCSMRPSSVGGNELILGVFSLLTTYTVNDLDPYKSWKNRIPVDLIWSAVVSISPNTSKPRLLCNTDNGVILPFPYGKDVVSQSEKACKASKFCFAVAPMSILASSVWCCYPAAISSKSIPVIETRLCRHTILRFRKAIIPATVPYNWSFVHLLFHVQTIREIEWWRSELQMCFIISILFWRVL